MTKSVHTFVTSLRKAVDETSNRLHNCNSCVKFMNEARDNTKERPARFTQLLCGNRMQIWLQDSQDVANARNPRITCSNCKRRANSGPHPEAKGLSNPSAPVVGAAHRPQQAQQGSALPTRAPQSHFSNESC